MGGVPGNIQTVPRAELTALLRAFELSEPFEVHVVSDCEYVVNTFNRGESQFDYLSARHADLWKKVFRAARNRIVCVSWFHAHQTMQECADISDEMLAKWHGNDSADKLATSKAESLRVAAPIRNKVLGLNSDYKMFCSFVADVLLHVVNVDKEPLIKVMRPLVARREKLTLKSLALKYNLLPFAPGRHRLCVRHGGSVQCSVCVASRS